MEVQIDYRIQHSDDGYQSLLLATRQTCTHSGRPDTSPTPLGGTRAYQW